MRGSLFSFGLVAPLPHEFLREGRQPQEILRNEAITGSERAIGSSGNADRPNKLNGAHRFPERHDAGVTVGAYIPDATTTLIARQGTHGGRVNQVIALGASFDL